MSIELTRVDFRLIHGQVITRWLTQCQINEIVTIDTALSKDAFMQEVFKMAAPKGVKITIVNVEDAVKRQQEGAFDKNRVMVLFKGVAELNAAVQAGLKLEKVQIGGLGGRVVRLSTTQSHWTEQMRILCLNWKRWGSKFISRQLRIILQKHFKKLSLNYNRRTCIW